MSNCNNNQDRELIHRCQSLGWTHYSIGILFGFAALIIGPTKVMIIGHVFVVFAIVVSRKKNPEELHFATWPLAILAGIFTNISMLFVLYEVYAMTLPYDILVPAESQSKFPRLYK